MSFRSMTIIAAAALMAGIVGLTAVAFAEGDDPIKSRREHMKGNGQVAKALSAMLDGSAPFDAAKAAEGTKSIAGVAHDFATEFDEYFPAGSDAGDTKASPDIWKNKDDFVKLASSLETDATAASAAATSLDAFKGPAGKMFGNCKACHEKYKLK